MSIFTESAKASLSGSKVMQNKTKVKTDDVITMFPDGITLTGFDILAKNEKSYAVFSFKENDKMYLNGGAILTKIALDWVALTDGDVSKASADLEKSGGVRIKLHKEFTGDKMITKVDILG